ncbi:MAG TPA: TadE family protein [Polyangiaceae bacterium]|jgi:hypothetical protein|nr:TadE family protein [Polyangiaceae bacterium]
MKNRARRGVATVEAVIAMPALLVMFLAVRFVFHRYDAMEGASAQARSCAYRYAATGCTTLPTDCAPASSKTESNGAASDDPNAANVASNVQTASHDLGIGSIPILSNVVDALLGSGTTSSADVAITDPLYVGTASFTGTGRMYMPCNETKQSDDVITAVFNAIKGVVK